MATGSSQWGQGPPSPTLDMKVRQSSQYAGSARLSGARIPGPARILSSVRPNEQLTTQLPAGARRAADANPDGARQPPEAGSLPVSRLASAPAIGSASRGGAPSGSAAPALQVHLSRRRGLVAATFLAPLAGQPHVVAEPPSRPEPPAGTCDSSPAPLS